jgi:hypothetical protein
MLRARAAGEHKLRPPRGQEIASISENGKKSRFAEGDGVIRLKVTAGKNIGLDFGRKLPPRFAAEPK